MRLLSLKSCYIFQGSEYWLLISWLLGKKRVLTLSFKSAEKDLVNFLYVLEKAQGNPAVTLSFKSAEKDLVNNTASCRFWEERKNIGKVIFHSFSSFFLLKLSSAATRSCPPWKPSQPTVSLSVYQSH